MQARIIDQAAYRLAHPACQALDGQAQLLRVGDIAGRGVPALRDLRVYAVIGGQIAGAGQAADFKAVLRQLQRYRRAYAAAGARYDYKSWTHIIDP
jgi:hypothetical protein